MATMSAVATTILGQMGGAARVSAMLGVTDFVYSDNALTIKYKAGDSRKGNLVRVTLDASDTYTVEFGYQRAAKYRTIKTVSYVYADNLVRVFQSATGLYLAF